MDWRFITRRSAVLAAVVGAGAALAAPAGALAATGSPVYASGSSFQANAHSVWTGAGKWSARTSLSAQPAFQYNGTSSGSGLSVFGNDDGTLKPAVDTRAPSGVLDGFVGSDDAPTPGQLNNARIAGGASELTVPVAQAPVAVLLSLPVNVTVTGRVNLQNALLEQAVAGRLPAAGIYRANSWGALLTLNNTPFTELVTPGTDANVLISVEVRLGGSGTSFAFKNYLNQIATDPTNPRTPDDSGVWANFLTGDQAWPASTPLVPSANNGGGALVKATAGTPGTIGYANLADAVTVGNGGFTNTATATTFGSSASHQILYAQLQNNGSATGPSATFAEGSGDTANLLTARGNCTTVSGRVAGWGNAPSDIRGSWTRVLASDTNIAADAGAGFYPACAVTYDIAWDNYNTTQLAGGYTNAAAGVTPSGVFSSVKDYLGYVASGAGQADIEAGGYNRLPAEIASKAQAAVAAIAFRTQDNGGGNGDPGTKSPPVTTPVVTPPVTTPVVTPPVVAHDSSAPNLKPKLTVSASAITVALSCPTTKASCTGAVALKATIRVKKGKKTVKKTISIGAGRVTIAGGRTKKLTVKLNSAGKAALKSSKKLSVKVTVSATDTYGGKKTTTLAATLKQPKATSKSKR
jgi:hypothetical protein